MVVPSTAAWAIHRAYPVARERTVAADIESMARKMAAMPKMLLQRNLSRLLREPATGRCHGTRVAVSGPVLEVSNLCHNHERRAYARPAEAPPGHSQRARLRSLAPPGRYGDGALHRARRHLVGDSARRRERQ